MGSMLLYIAAPWIRHGGWGITRGHEYSDSRRAKIAEAAAARRERGRFEWQDLSITRPGELTKSYGKP